MRHHAKPAGQTRPVRLRAVQAASLQSSCRTPQHIHSSTCWVTTAPTGRPTVLAFNSGLLACAHTGCAAGAQTALSQGFAQHAQTTWPIVTTQQWHHSACSGGYSHSSYCASNGQTSTQQHMNRGDSNINIPRGRQVLLASTGSLDNQAVRGRVGGFVATGHTLSAATALHTQDQDLHTLPCVHAKEGGGGRHDKLSSHQLSGRCCSCTARSSVVQGQVMSHLRWRRSCIHTSGGLPKRACRPSQQKCRPGGTEVRE
jgi:hypothetical protein